MSHKSTKLWPRDGIGIHSTLKMSRRKDCGFESHRGYHILGVILDKVYGPYIRPDGRKFMSILRGGKRNHKTSTLYSRWLMEQHLGRILDDNLETVDHIDRDYTNDSLDNLRVISRAQHAKEDNRRVKDIKIVCIWCGIEAFKSPNDLRGNAKQRKAGPFCGKSCAGKYGAEVQNNRQKILGRTELNLTSEYYYTEKQ